MYSNEKEDKSISPGLKVVLELVKSESLLSAEDLLTLSEELELRIQKISNSLEKVLPIRMHNVADSPDKDVSTTQLKEKPVKTWRDFRNIIRELSISCSVTSNELGLSRKDEAPPSLTPISSTIIACTAAILRELRNMKK